ncbi:MAG: tRNA preQ1(34) S-adenosylmethionine ribosyltransferase-isomerase QueA [Candidatus Omnitrophica bacterium]|nr:tRNA preQ1(34) S-adenosylmethionine ribosyltransferase-isomerase QueA [Candidatus Omnitrophota bacterium]MBU0878631.1 tRNA preQ1(34) S-adenosylmethionine ribosyltransferase-isomerase QueA [Candidatus Omnitrophota bacterium]MBU1810315.1 tRNA preQ1(34) S-adenosylmethionine ribosyltransferase-isomerase QueA [Candidatus Omnitrophota bacterium]
MKRDEFGLSHFNYEIPSSLIAQEPVFPRDSCRLLIVNRKKKSVEEGVFGDVVSFLNRGDVLVLNDTKVIKARLTGRKESGGKVEVLLLKEREEGAWEVLVKPGKRAKINDTIIFEENTLSPSNSKPRRILGIQRGKPLTGLTAKVLDKTPQGGRVLQFFPPNLRSSLGLRGKVPLPPYIKKEIDDSGNYQTVYAKREGAVAAPTAGLHFTQNLLNAIKKKEVEIAHITLHCGLATFRPVKTEDIRDHKMGREWIDIDSKTAGIINRAKKEFRRVVAVGTTAVRALESIVCLDEKGVSCIKPFTGETSFYIFPGYKFKIVDCLITNFHTPCSTNLILVSSFSGRELIKESYAYAMKRNFRFYSFGDAMLII